MKLNKLTVLFIINLIVILPLFYLSFYTYPSSDDFSYGMESYKGFEGFIQTQVDFYNRWSSRYMATAFLITSPLSFGTDQYFGIYPIFYIILFYFANLRVLKDAGVENNRIRFLLNLSIISIYTLLQTSLVENYFWLAGSATYFLPSIVFIFYLSCLLRIYKHKSLLKNFFFGVFCIFIIGGCSELLIAFSGIITFFFMLAYFVENKKISRYYFLLTSWIACIVLFIALSPGNAARATIKEADLSLLDVFIMALRKILAINLRYLIFAFILFLLLFRVTELKIRLHKNLRNPLFIFLFYNALLFIGSFITIYKLTYYPPPRVENLLIFFSMIFVFILSYLFYETYNHRISKLQYFIIGTGVLAAYLFIPKNSFQIESNLQLIYSDIFSGKVRRYKEQLEARKELVKTCDECIVPPIKEEPKTILFKDITDDTKHYINISVSKYYKIRSIRTNE